MYCAYGVENLEDLTISFSFKMLLTKTSFSKIFNDLIIVLNFIFVLV